MPKKRDHGQGALYQVTRKRKLKDGTVREYTLWRGVVDLGFDTEGKRVQPTIHAKTQREAKRKLDDLMSEIRDHGAPLDKQVLLGDYAPRWLAEVAKPDVDPNTYTTYKSMVNRWIVPTLGRKKISDLTPGDVRALRTTIINAPRSSSTARQAHIVLRRILETARTERLCRTNVADDVKAPRAAKGNRGAIPTPQALDILRTAAADVAGSRWWFKLMAGQRQGEILGATLEDLDLEIGPDGVAVGGFYRVSWKLEQIAREHGCEGGDLAPSCGKTRGFSCPQWRWRVPDGHENRHLQGRWHLTRPKSQVHRVVPLIPELAEAIRRHVEATAGQPNPYGLIWHMPDGSPILPADDGQQWRDLLQAAGVITAEQNKPGGTELTGHIARHTAITALAALGVDMQLIGEIVGHSSRDVTEIYRHADQAEKVAAVAKLGNAWSDALGPLQIEA